MSVTAVLNASRSIIEYVSPTTLVFIVAWWLVAFTTGIGILLVGNKLADKKDAYFSIVFYVTSVLVIGAVFMLYVHFFNNFPLIFLVAWLASMIGTAIAITFDNLLKGVDTTTMKESDNTKDAFIRRSFLYLAVGFMTGIAICTFRKVCPITKMLKAYEYKIGNN